MVEQDKHGAMLEVQTCDDTSVIAEWLLSYLRWILPLCLCVTVDLCACYILLPIHAATLIHNCVVDGVGDVMLQR